MSRTQIFTLISVASVNFGSMICYSILGPFFPHEALQKGASQTVVGLIFGCFALSQFIAAGDAVGFAAALTSSIALVMTAFPDTVATVLVGLADPDATGMLAMRRWFLFFGGLLSALGFGFLGPAPQLWLMVFMMCVTGFGLGMSVMPSLPEIVSVAL
ncbi:hypothetical protein CRUP_038036 [Coryphaenoides rupestris]|nr:hypothetical protein CRUP_038036 [Coryphaenoides rupestris]